jgi:hypothetical protein
MKHRRKLAVARLLSPIQLKMLDAGQPVVVECSTPSGGKVEVRLQTANLEYLESDPSGKREKGSRKGSWLNHGVYIAVLSDSSEGEEISEKTSGGKRYSTLPIGQMYRVLRGLPGKLKLTSDDGEKITITYFNPNAPANRCYETKGLSITMEVSSKGSGRKVINCGTKKLTSKELNVLRSGTPLDLKFGERILTLQSNLGGQLVELPNVRKK